MTNITSLLHASYFTLSSKRVRIGGGGGGGRGFLAKKEGTPPTLSSEALLSKKIDENGKNSAKIVQNRKK
jgi:hypothetical protein